MAYTQILVRQMCIAGFGVLEAAATITPGFLLQRTSENKCYPHGTVGGASQKMIAVEKDGQSIDDTYVSGEDVSYKICRAGDHAYMILKDGEAVSVGSWCCSNGDGKLRNGSGSTYNVVGEAIEAVTANGDSRVLVEIY